MRAFQISALVETAVRDERERGIIRSKALEDAARQALEFIRWSQFDPSQSGELPEPPSTAPQIEAALSAALAEPVSKAQA